MRQRRMRVGIVTQVNRSRVLVFDQRSHLAEPAITVAFVRKGSPGCPLTLGARCCFWLAGATLERRSCLL